MSIYRLNKHNNIELLLSHFKTMHFASNFKIIDFEVLKTINLNLYFEFSKTMKLNFQER